MTRTADFDGLLFTGMLPLSFSLTSPPVSSTATEHIEGLLFVETPCYAAGAVFEGRISAT
jgi:hypothetical protein